MTAPRNPIDADMRAALALADALKPIFADVKARLPEGTNFAILVDVPLSDGNGTVVAMATDRERMARCAGSWILSETNPLGADPSKRRRT